jgi:hypothetical protein
MRKESSMSLFNVQVEPNVLHNSLEPQSIIDSFLNHPPEDFNVKIIESDGQEFYGFLADLDLFLTVDKPLKDFAERFLKWGPLKKLFTPNVLFVGTAVSEYSLFPKKTNINQFISDLLSVQKTLKKQFVIFKDLPFKSPLLNKADNDFSSQLTDSLKKNDFIIIEGQLIAYKTINFSSFEEYLNNFSKNRKFNFKKKRKAMQNYKTQILDTGDEFFTNNVVNILYDLYLNVHNKSDIQFEILSLGFFKNIFQNTFDGKVFVYSEQNKIIGFCLYYVVDKALMDKYHGYLYPDAHKHFLYFNHFFDNLEFCIKNNLNTCIMGGANAETKAYLGCEFTQSYHAVYIKNPLLRNVLKQFKGFFESDKIK